MQTMLHCSGSFAIFHRQKKMAVPKIDLKILYLLAFSYHKGNYYMENLIVSVLSQEIKCEL